LINKRAPMEVLVGKGIVQVAVDTTYDGVVVPPSFVGGHIMLNFSYRYRPGDLTIDDFGIRATLSFSGQSFKVEVPWGSVAAMASLVTGEVVEFELEPHEPTFQRASGDIQPTESTKFKLYVVPDEPGIPKMFSTPRTGHLRLLKN